MKRQISEEILKKYKIPASLTDFQLSLYIHLIEWKWKNITTKTGVHGNREYDAILPKEYQEDLYPLYQPIVGEIKQNHKFKVHKHFGHMASSQAACINLFTPILRDHKIANTILPKINSRFSKLASDKLQNGFQFEYWDKTNPLKDHTDAAGTDSDIAIAYYDIQGKSSLWLIEHKLTEDEFTTCGGYRSRGNLIKSNCRSGAEILKDSSKCYYQYHCGYTYWAIMHSCKIYNQAILSEKEQCPFIRGENQLWRNQLMGQAIQNKGEYENVHFSVVYHPHNPDLLKTINSYEEMLEDKTKFGTFTSRQIIDQARRIKDKNIQNWVEWYSGLYRIN